MYPSAALGTMLQEFSFQRLGVTCYADSRLAGARHEKRKTWISSQVNFCVFLTIAEIVLFQFLQNYNNIFFLDK